MSAVKNIDTHIGKQLRLRRTMMGLSQNSVAEAVGITFQQVQKYEKGTNALNASRLYQFSAFMKVPVAHFFEGFEGRGLRAAKGFGEADGEIFVHEGAASDRESLEMMKAFKRIKEQIVRKRVADLVRAVADNKTIMD
jgi:transcriptional regulator with XRE-family HTH domain